jgi:hypothetical protein
MASGSRQEVEPRAAVPHVAWGRLKMLAVSSAQRSPAAQDVPTVEEELAARKKPGRECSRRWRFGDRTREYRPIYTPAEVEGVASWTRLSRILGERRLAPCAPMSRDPRYQGSPFKSGACADCSGNPPAICINVMTSTPAHPPPINAANTHQNETIGSPLLALMADRDTRLRPARFVVRRVAYIAVCIFLSTHEQPVRNPFLSVSITRAGVHAGDRKKCRRIRRSELRNGAPPLGRGTNPAR